jgi:nucleotide-binding universal stress UspA family protein
MPDVESVGPVLFGYDGSELSGFAITYAASQLATPRDALVVCIWQPADVGFTPIGGQHFDADRASEVRSAAEEVAAHGAELAQNAGFRARALAVEAAPTWKGIVATAEQEKAGLIVLGAHRRGGLARHLLGDVAAAVVAHAPCSVLVVHQRA